MRRTAIDGLTSKETARHLGVSPSTVKLWADLLGLSIAQGQESEGRYDAESLRVLETVKNLRSANRGYKTIVKVIHFNKNKPAKIAANLNLRIPSAEGQGDIVVECPAPTRPQRETLAQAGGEPSPDRPETITAVESPSTTSPAIELLERKISFLEKLLAKLPARMMAEVEKKLGPALAGTQDALARQGQEQEQQATHRYQELEQNVVQMRDQIQGFYQQSAKNVEGLRNVFPAMQEMESQLQTLGRQMGILEDTLEKIITHQESNITQEELTQLQGRIQETCQQPMLKLVQKLSFMEQQQEALNVHLNKIAGQHQILKENMLSKEQVSRQFGTIENKIFNLLQDVVSKSELDQKFTVIVNQNDELQQKLVHKMQNTIDRYELNERLYPIIEAHEALRKDILFLKTLNSELMQRNIQLERGLGKPPLEAVPPKSEWQKPYEPAAFAAPPAPDTNISIYRNLGLENNEQLVNDQRIQPGSGNKAMRNLEEISYKLSKLEDKLRLKDDKVSLLENYVLRQAGQTPKGFLAKLKTFMDS